MAERVARGTLCHSSLKVYDSRWKGFCTQCSARRLSPWHATVQQIAEFLHDLFKKGDLKVHMIEGYKSAITATLKARGMNVGTEPHICRLISSFYMDRLAGIKINLVPRWDHYSSS